MAHQSSHCETANRVPSENHIGNIFRKYGEAYIAQYQPSLDKIMLIRNVRKCKTPAMGKVVTRCKGCGDTTEIYKSCGDNKCPVCQSIKRFQAQQKISEKMLNVPYVHVTFTLPHKLNSLLRANQKVLYSLLYQSAWHTIKTLCADPKNVGAEPGMIALLHTWGSDMKYHVHLHTLITFGGLDKGQNWHFPTRKKKLAGYRKIRKEFRKTYLKGLKALDEKGQLKPVPFMQDLIKEAKSKTWVVHNGKPKIKTESIETYLAHYITKIAVSNHRLNFDEVKERVSLVYNDYRKQKKGKAAPKLVKKLDPLSFMHQFLQHLPPKNFQRLRYYGLHSSRKYRQIKDKIPDTLKRNSSTIKTLFQIIKAMLDIDISVCTNCQSCDFERDFIAPDSAWLSRNVKGYRLKKKGRSPPAKQLKIAFKVQ